MMFRAGQKVACVDALSRYADVPSPLIRGGVYTILRVLPPRPTWLDEGYGLELAEVKPTANVSPGFLASRFRPIVEKKTDISVFTALLNTKQRENVLCGND